MVHHHIRNPTIKSHVPITYLDMVCMGQQMEYLEQDTTYLKTSKIMRYFHSKSEEMKISAQILESLGYVKYHCGVQNDPKRLRNLKNKLDFLRLIAEIFVVEEKETTDEQKVKDAEIRAFLPASKAKLVAKDMDVSKLTK